MVRLMVFLCQAICTQRTPKDLSNRRLMVKVLITVLRWHGDGYGDGYGDGMVWCW